MPQDRPIKPLDALREPGVVVWAMLAGIGLAAILALAPGVAGDRLVRFGLAVLGIEWIVLSALAALYVLGRPLSRFHWAWTLSAAFALLLVATLGLHVAAEWALPRSGDVVAEQFGPAVLRSGAIATVVFLMGAAALLNHSRAQQLAIRAKQAELQSLQARIRPHFLFNTLNTGAALVHERPEQAEQLLLDLSDLFRAALAGPRKIPLAEELGLARRYLEIEQLRFGERLRVRWELPRDIPPVPVPALSIQPLVENAVRHGAERMAHADIEITVSTTPDTVVVRITNPIPPAAPGGHDGHRVGLHASQARIEALTGGRGSVRTEVAEGRFVATVRLPVGEG